MNKRLRKKLRKGEFKELGFRLNVSLARSLDEQGMDARWDGFIDLVESLGLSVGVGGHYDHVYAVSSATKRGSVTPSQQKELEIWLSANPMLENFQISTLFDVWYPPQNMLD